MAGTPATRPRIGIVTRHDYGKTFFVLHRAYTEVVAAAGGLPLVLPLIIDRELIGDTVASLDGLVITGSVDDINPALYGEEPRPGCGVFNPLRDKFDTLLLAAALERGLPILGICSGMQRINVFLGGTLYQNLEREIPGGVKHDYDDPFVEPSHSIRVEPDSVLGKLVSSGQSWVNSQHHQGIKELARGLRPIAWSSDGLAEAFYREEGSYVLGVQWHPERSYLHDDGFSLAVVRHFVEACARRGG